MSEWYTNGLAPDTSHLIFSVSKSIAGTMAFSPGPASSIPMHPSRYVPEIEASVYGRDCTVRQLLDMSVDIRFDEDYGDVMNYRGSTG